MKICIAKVKSNVIYDKHSLLHRMEDLYCRTKMMHHVSLFMIHPCVCMDGVRRMESVLSIYQTKRFHCCCRDQVGGSQLTADDEGDIKHSPFHLAAQTCKPCLTMLKMKTIDN